MSDAYECAREYDEERLRRDRRRGEARGVSIETNVAGGEPARSIVEYAEGEGVDRMFVDSRGCTGIPPIPLCSVQNFK